MGGIIGKGGEKIKEIRNTSGANVKVFQNPAPQSTDRCVQVNRALKHYCTVYTGHFHGEGVGGGKRI